MTDELNARSRTLLGAARDAEPTLGEDARSRMRSKILAGIGASGIAATTTTAASATGGTAVGMGAAPVGSVTAVFGVKGLAMIGLAAVAASGMMLVVYDESRLPVAIPAITAPPSASRVFAPPASPPVSATPFPAGSARIERRSESVAEGAANVVTSARSASALGIAPAAHVDRAAASTPAPTDQVFVKDLQALDRARAALTAHEPRRALAELDASPPSSKAFAEERAALRVVALCESGQTASGRLELTRFRATFPRSLQNERMDRACATRAVTDSAEGGHEPE